MKNKKQALTAILLIGIILAGYFLYTSYSTDNIDEGVRLELNASVYYEDGSVNNIRSNNPAFWNLLSITNVDKDVSYIEVYINLNPDVNIKGEYHTHFQVLNDQKIVDSGVIDQTLDLQKDAITTIRIKSYDKYQLAEYFDTPGQYTFKFQVDVGTFNYIKEDMSTTLQVNSRNINIILKISDDQIQPSPFPTQDSQQPTTSPSPSSTPTTPPQTGVIFEENFESGNFNKWSGNLMEGDVQRDVSVTSGSAHSGNYKAVYTISPTTSGASAGKWVVIPSQTTLKYKASINIKTLELPSPGNWVSIMSITQSTNDVLVLRLQNINGDLKLYLISYDGSGWHNVQAPWLYTNQWIDITLEWTQNGTQKILINNNEVGKIIHQPSSYLVDRIRLGVIWKQSTPVSCGITVWADDVYVTT